MPGPLGFTQFKTLSSLAPPSRHRPSLENRETWGTDRSIMLVYEITPFALAGGGHDGNHGDGRRGANV